MEADMTRQSHRNHAAIGHRESAEAVKLIRKLRWIGMEEEADRAQARLGSSSSFDCVLAGPSDTD
jgi:hypothetical protein